MEQEGSGYMSLCYSMTPGMHLVMYALPHARPTSIGRVRTYWVKEYTTDINILHIRD